MIDLHTHTYYSDGKYAPAEVVRAAAERGVTILAITDHDNGRGSREAAQLSQAVQLVQAAQFPQAAQLTHAAQLTPTDGRIKLIPAIELTTRWPGAKLPSQDANVDVLGYFVNLNDPLFQAYEMALLNDLHDRIDATCRQMRKAGYPISMEDVFEDNPYYGGAMQLIHVLINKRLVKGWDAAFELLDVYWLNGRETPFTIRAAIEQVHLAGGVAVLAHPSIVRPEGEQMTARWLKQLVDWGLDGIEIYHYRLDEGARAHFLGLARTFDLLVSGGSDFHGWGRGFENLGREPVTDAMVERMLERAKIYRITGGNRP